MKLKVVISGGGTGGHIFPGIAVAKSLLELKPDTKILFVGGKGQRESKIVPDYGFDFAPILVQGFPRKLSLKWLKVFVKVPAGFFKSLAIISKFKPDVVLGTGGYVCGPVLLAAWFLGKPVVIQEQNVLPGITNKILSKLAKEIYVPFSEAEKFLPKGKTKVTGNPIRSEIVTTPDTHEKLGLDKNKMTITFLGGSQGANSINMAMIDALKYLSDMSSKIQMIHQTGENDFTKVEEAYRKSPFKAIVQPFFNRIEDIYASTDLVVCRSGGTVAEVASKGLPSILIPYPYSAGDHQTFNAKAFEENGAAIMLKDSQLTGELLANTIISLIKDKDRLSSMSIKSKSMGKPDAAQEIARSVISLVSENISF
jgi:UDP-N-acetylglucosamine--N-acetylmuramyl-(pentapeptide) pyrophosphoryl-undecaprenol N-acetylglucosamine transferase